MLSATPRIDRYLSDHAAILCSLRVNKPTLSAKNVSYRRVKSIDITSCNQDLLDSRLCQSPPDDIDELVAFYTSSSPGPSSGGPHSGPGSGC